MKPKIIRLTKGNKKPKIGEPQLVPVGRGKDLVYELAGYAVDVKETKDEILVYVG